MSIEQLRKHQKNIAGVKETIDMLRAKQGYEGQSEVTAALTSCVDVLAGVVGDLVDEMLESGEHTAAVAEMLRRDDKAPAPRMTLQEGRSSGSRTVPGGE